MCMFTHTYMLELFERLIMCVWFVVAVGAVAEKLPSPWQTPLVSPLARSPPHSARGPGTALLLWQPASGQVGTAFV